MNIIEYRARTGRRSFSPAFEALLRAVYGLPLEEAQRALFTQMSGGRTDRPGVGFDEIFVNAGRGSGKDDTLSTIVNYECRYGGHEVAAAPGQRIPALIVCPLKYQAQGTLRMVQGEANLAFNRARIVAETKDSVEFKNGTVAQVQAADDTAMAGDTLAMLAFNEWSLMPGDEAAVSARQIEATARPALRRMIGAKRKRFFKFGSSYSKEGPAWECYRDYFGRDWSDVLVVSGPTQFWNPNVDPEFLASERRKLGDLLYRMHYECEWMDVVLESFFGTTYTGAIQAGKFTLPHAQDGRIIIAVDQKFSPNSPDRFAWAAASSQVGEWNSDTNTRGPRLTKVHACDGWVSDRSPRDMAAKLRDQVCSRFGTRKIIIDQYSSHAFAQLCRDVGLDPTVVAWKAGGSKAEKLETERDEERELSKTDRYHSFRMAMASGDLQLCAHPELIHDLGACRSKMLPSGSERIFVPRTTRGHGDVLSAVVMAATQAMSGRAHLPLSEMTSSERIERTQNLRKLGSLFGCVPDVMLSPREREAAAARDELAGVAYTINNLQRSGAAFPQLPYDEYTKTTATIASFRSRKAPHHDVRCTLASGTRRLGALVP